MTAPDPTPLPDPPPRVPPLGPIPGTEGRPGPDYTGQQWPLTATPEATGVTIGGDDCGHLPGEAHDGSCAYWAGVARGEYQPPAWGSVVVLPVHAPGLAPLRDRALDGAA